MKFVVAFAVALLLSGCFPIAPHIYAPADRPFEAIDWKMCEPTYRAVMLEAADHSVNFMFRPRGDGLFGILELVSPRGVPARFVSNEVVAIADGEAQPAAELAESYDRFPHGEAAEVRSYSLSVPLPSEPSELSITLPPMTVGTRKYPPAKFVFRRRVQPMIMGLCQ